MEHPRAAQEPLRTRPEASNIVPNASLATKIRPGEFQDRFFDLFEYKKTNIGVFSIASWSKFAIMGARKALQESKTAQGASKAPPRALQKSLLRPQVASKSSPEEPSKPPALGLQPLACLLLLRFMGQQVASAGCAKR